MSTSIYYFSGTGNSLRTAEILRGKIPDARLFNIAAEFAAGRFAIDADRLVFIYPAYAYEMPHMVRRFIRRARVKCAYAAALVTFGSHPGGALAECKRLLKRKKIRLDYAAKIPAVENFIPIFGAPDEKTKAERLSLQTAAAHRAADGVANAETNKIHTFHPLAKCVSLFFRAAKPLLVKMYEVTDDCTGCGLCARICPAGAIEPDENGRPVFHSNCEVCQGCLNYCPARALHFFRLKEGVPRYRHPEISAARRILRESPRPARAAVPDPVPDSIVDSVDGEVGIEKF
ncbi:MAG: EFR1 family ferrodoxin [Clostridiales bacterium]|jgi:ferredoxin|nr:EFR1 family ferrodoxin [Clostridiales bacterium]